MQASSKDIQLFNETGINVEDKNYTKDEVERLKISVTDFIVSQSTKDIDKYSKKKGWKMVINYFYWNTFTWIYIYDCIVTNYISQ